MTDEGPSGLPRSPGDDDRLWLSVMNKMDETWAELVGQQVELERKNAELEGAHAFMAGVFDSMSDVLVACDTALRVVRTNQAAERLFPAGADGLAGRLLTELVDARSPTTAADVANAIARRQRLEDREFMLAAAAGPMPFAVNGTVLYDARRRPSGVVLAARPLGELRRAYTELDRAHRSLKDAQAQLVQAEKMASLGRLVAGVAHELNNPISFVYGNAHTLRRFTRRLEAYLAAIHAHPRAADFARQRQDLRIDMVLSELDGALSGIVEGAERVRDIVADLRRFSADRRAPGTPFDLAGVARTALDWVLATCGRSVTVHADLDSTLEVDGHAGQMQQVVMNLVQNAVDAMEGIEHPALDIAGARRGGRVCLTIRDNGPGIAPEIMDRIFDPFFTTKPVGKGTGLGLAICYRMVTEHGGLLAASRHPAGGTTMTLDLPAFMPDDGHGNTGGMGA
ncbi:signal transduction histidine kinase [Gluconacetobacter johannae DSM 13595]|uniref:histidine kinase n=1 Tax=Gluconacetobacter johannae TaxID=112140 RepID=A0A7W4P3Y8_9PROT|nr:ATP-binding protein [Gluconacetobacter johannae]MBB2176696.1 PAS domain-containing protein [Gluconacetobacter johannae]GBQ91368.1 signal transduction histidine kinase [Gluconacetobacter johannae DSM 13595]